MEDAKCQACRVILAEDKFERRMQYRQLIRELEKTNCKTMDRIQGLENLQALTQLEALQRLEVTNIDYKDYEYKEGDIVYCDVPYEKIGKTNCDDYGLEFNNKEFYEWAKTRDYQVFFSSYEISDDSFYKVKIKKVIQLIGANTNSTYTNEYLYSNKEIKLPKEVANG